MVLEADLVKALNLKTIIAAENGRLNIEVSNVNRPDCSWPVTGTFSATSGRSYWAWWR